MPDGARARSIPRLPAALTQSSAAPAVSRGVVSLPVIPFDHVTHADDYFRCESYSMKLSAGMCGKRQEEAHRVLRTKDKWMSGRGNLEKKKCIGCKIGAQIVEFVKKGPRRAPKAERKGSLVIPARTRVLLGMMFADSSIAHVARETGLAWGTVARAVRHGQVRRKSFNRLAKMFPDPAQGVA